MYYGYELRDFFHGCVRLAIGMALGINDQIPSSEHWAKLIRTINCDDESYKTIEWKDFEHILLEHMDVDEGQAEGGVS